MSIIRFESAFKELPKDALVLLDTGIPNPEKWLGDVKTLCLGRGEGLKSTHNLIRLWEELAPQLHRKSTLVAFGGGALLDLSGFLASTLYRGLNLIYVPTTLLSMVDSAIGGKTAINLFSGKNLVGSFYLPNEVWIEPKFLETLPERELLSGYGEIIKTALLSDHPTLKTLVPNTLPSREIIQTCIEFKSMIVTQDPQEKNLRAILNFGHTIGHALEAFLEYKETHGVCVFWGLLLECQILKALGFLPKEPDLLRETEPYYPKLPPLKAQELMPWLQVDKKNTSQGIALVLPQEQKRLQNLKQALIYINPQDFENHLHLALNCLKRT